MIPLILSWEYFPNHKGLITGLVIGSFGFGSFVFGFVWLALVNPDGISPQKDVAGGKVFEGEIAESVPYNLRLMCLIWAGITIVSIPLMRRMPQLDIDKPGEYELLPEEQPARNPRLS